MSLKQKLYEYQIAKQRQKEFEKMYVSSREKITVDTEPDTLKMACFVREWIDIGTVVHEKKCPYFPDFSLGEKDRCKKCEYLASRAQYEIIRVELQHAIDAKKHAKKVLLDALNPFNNKNR